MKAEQYLIISADGSKTHIAWVDHEGLERHLAQASEYAEMGGRDPIFLEDINRAKYGTVEPGEWPEGTELIVKVTVVVPRPVTTKWSV